MGSSVDAAKPREESEHGDQAIETSQNKKQREKRNVKRTECIRTV